MWSCSTISIGSEMASISKAISQWIRWCHGDQPLHVAEGALEAVVRMAHQSPYAEPVVLSERAIANRSVRGYAVACEGSIAFLGRVRCSQTQANEGLSPASEIGKSATQSMHLTTTTTEPTCMGMAEVISGVMADLSRSVFAKGVEMVQSILPAGEPTPEIFELSLAFRAAGFQHAATLVQMECIEIPMRYDESPLAYEFLPVRFVPFSEISYAEWCRLVEQTYLGTLDVPKLNGVRTTEATLRGYAVGQAWDALQWWSIHIDEDPIGCLMLTPLSERTCELTYLGLIPEARGHRYSPEIMDFIGQWMNQHAMEQIVLAVDEKNAPAIHLYQSFGFREIQAIDAWFIANPKS